MLFKFVPPSSPSFSLLCVHMLATIFDGSGVFISPSLPIFLFSIVDMGVLAFPEVFTGFNAGTQPASLPPCILELFCVIGRIGPTFVVIIIIYIIILCYLV